jgi:hypothetical protein
MPPVVVQQVDRSSIPWLATGSLAPSTASFAATPMLLGAFVAWCLIKWCLSQNPVQCSHAKGRIVGVNVLDDEGEAAGPQKVGGGEVAVEGVEGCSGTCVLPQPQSGKVAAAAVEAEVGCIDLWEITMCPVVGHPCLGDVVPQVIDVGN